MWDNAAVHCEHFVWAALLSQSWNDYTHQLITRNIWVGCEKHLLRAVNMWNRLYLQLMFLILSLLLNQTTLHQPQIQFRYKQKRVVYIDVWLWLKIFGGFPLDRKWCRLLTKPESLLMAVLRKQTLCSWLPNDIRTQATETNVWIKMDVKITLLVYIYLQGLFPTLSPVKATALYQAVCPLTSQAD